MKKVYLSALAIAAGLFVTAQGPPPPNPSFENGSFEDWTSGAPDGWTANAILLGSNGATISNPANPITEETTGATDGSSFIRLETFELSDSPIPQIPDGVTGATVSQDFSSTTKYDTISMDVSYDIQGSDKGMIYIAADDASGNNVLLVNHDLEGAEANLTTIDIPITYTGDPEVYTIMLASSEEAVFGTQAGVATAELGSWISVDNIVMQTADPDVPNISNLVASDISDNGDGTDLEVTFTVPADESNIDSYVLLAFESQYGPSNSQDPIGVFDPTLGAVTLTPDGSDQTHTFSSSDTYLAVSGGNFTPTPIEEDEEMIVYVLVKAKSGYSSLIEDSNPITLTSSTSGLLTETVQNAVVYPNPAQEQVNVTTGFDNGNVVINSVTGQEVANGVITNGTSKIDVSNLKNGVYIYTIRDNNNEVVKTNKLVIQ